MIGLSQKAPWPRLLPDPPRFRRLLGLQGTQLWRGGWPGPEDSIYRVSFWNQAQLGILQYNSAPDVMDVTIHSAVGSAGATSEGLGWSNLERGAQPVYKPRAGPSIHKPTEQALAMAHQAVHRATSCGQAHVSGCPGSLSPVVRASPKRAGHVGQQSLRHCNKRTEHRLQSTAVTLPEPSTSQEPLAFEVDPRGVERIAFQPKGWRSWTWRGSRVNYLAAGDHGTPIVLVHGFGASVYHWRYNIPALAKTHRVFALDMLGFGWSEKPVLEYSGCQLWAQQVADFIKQVVGEPAALAGNSLGGYTCLLCATQNPQQVKGVVLLNAAGRFSEPQAVVETALQDETSGPLVEAVQEEAAKGNGASSSEVEQPAQRRDAQQAPPDEQQPGLLSRMWEPIRAIGMRAAVYGAFVATKQPFRIKQVLKQVYANHENIDDELVQSIVLPANDKNAAAIFYRVITGWGQPVNNILDQLQVPLLLLWGELDPWITSDRASRIQQLYPKAEYVGLESGHCPQDDTPEPVNKALMQWLDKLP